MAIDYEALFSNKSTEEKPKVVKETSDGTESDVDTATTLSSDSNSDNTSDAPAVKQTPPSSPQGLISRRQARELERQKREEQKQAEVKANSDHKVDEVEVGQDSPISLDTAKVQVQEVTPSPPEASVVETPSTNEIARAKQPVEKSVSPEALVEEVSSSAKPTVETKVVVEPAKAEPSVEPTQVNVTEFSDDEFVSSIESVVLNVLEKNLESSVGSVISDVMANSADISLLASKNMPFVSSGGAILKDKNGRDKYDKEYSGKLTQVKLPSHIVQSIKSVVPPGATNNDAVSAYVAAMIKDPTGLSEKGRVIYDDLRAVDSLEMLTREIERQHKVLEDALKDVKAKESMIMTMMGDIMLSSNGFARQSYPTQVSHLTFDSNRVDKVADMLRVVHRDTQNGLPKNVISDYTSITPRSGL